MTIDRSPDKAVSTSKVKEGPAVHQGASPNGYHDKAN